MSSEHPGTFFYEFFHMDCLQVFYFSTNSDRKKHWGLL